MHNKLLGKFGEDLACAYLTRKGYKLVSRNIKLSYQELDIVAIQEKVLVFVEVKTRMSKWQEGAEEAMNRGKYHNLKKAILHYLETNKLPKENFRLDMIAIYVDKLSKKANIKHYFDVI